MPAAFGAPRILYEKVTRAAVDPLVAENTLLVLQRIALYR